MLTRFVRIQLALFLIASVIGVSAMIFGYMQVPTLLGIGRVTVKLDLPETGGLYRFSNVTYNGVQIGTVTNVELTPGGVRATLSLSRSPKIPADLTAAVRSVSAIGEQYVDLLPRSDGGPYLQNGSVIAASDTQVPQQVGPMLDQVSALVDSIPKDRLSDLLDETFQAFDGAGYDFQSLLDSATTISGDANRVADKVRKLVDDGAPLLDSQEKSTDAIRTWARSVAGISEQVAVNDPQLRAILQRGPGFAEEVSGLMQDLKPTLPILLANLNTLGQVLMVYNPSLEQLMVLLPGYIAAQQSFGLPKNNPTGLPQGDFTLTFGDPNPCTVGFLPASSWRSPADTTTIDTPDGLYCKLPQDSPVSVRGARNFPCIEHPGKRAPTVELCDDPKGFVPIAMRQHLTGPGPIDPNLLKQGIPIDDRADFNDRIFAPTGGTPLPPWATPSGTSPDSPRPEVPAPPPPFAGHDGSAEQRPPVAVLPYDPNTGKYMTPDGRYEQQTNLVPGSGPKTWTDLMPS
ncbi:MULTISPECIES: MCE family protein [Mycolicibacter]|uniref:Mammalian cell entry protein n=2 Tax=Mycolicibacter algericus TaxID=1288388 RepID=A0A7I9YDI0_MYCAL|nr:MULTISPECIES: MlaD family protein [Mycolicibacter]OQZ97349.1 virulence factor Mce [Mycolicibacter algericus DSM 45454]RAV02254.1 MCE family protein [Mycolicibacter senuensis]GFG86572.1 mammalian cell entry protein [Mycolicibacter algericus]